MPVAARRRDACRELLSNILPAAIDIARAAGAVLMEHFGHATRSGKGGLDLVTEADLASEALIVRQLHARFPEHRVVAEESASGDSTPVDGGELTWYVDPLDGTGNFSRSDAHFAVAIGLVHRDRPMLGVVYNPARDILFTAAEGEEGGEPRLNGTAIRRAAGADTLKSATIATDWPWELDLRQRTLSLLQAAAPGIRQTKIRGCATLDICDVARGFLDAYLHPGCMPWDLAGPLAINRAVGSTILTAERWRDVRSQPVMVAAPALAPLLGPLAAALSEKPLGMWE